VPFILGGRVFKGQHPGPWGDNSERVNMHIKFLKTSRTSRPVSIKLGTNHPLVKGIQNQI
jgi:hypothetical protein